MEPSLSRHSQHYSDGFGEGVRNSLKSRTLPPRDESTVNGSSHSGQEGSSTSLRHSYRHASCATWPHWNWITFSPLNLCSRESSHTAHCSPTKDLSFLDLRRSLSFLAVGGGLSIKVSRTGVCICDFVFDDFDAFMAANGLTMCTTVPLCLDSVPDDILYCLKWDAVRR